MDENPSQGPQNEQQTEQSQQDAEAQQWKGMEELIGPPTEGYEHWGQVPEEQFWKVTMEKLFKNK